MKVIFNVSVYGEMAFKRLKQSLSLNGLLQKMYKYALHEPPDPCSSMIGRALIKGDKSKIKAGSIVSL